MPFISFHGIPSSPSLKPLCADHVNHQATQQRVPYKLRSIEKLRDCPKTLAMGSQPLGNCLDYPSGVWTFDGLRHGFYVDLRRETTPFFHAAVEVTRVRQALISDIHSNFEALQAVLADISSQNVDKLICLGDVVGYGPNPCECLETVMRRAELTIMGNHDQAALFDPDGFNPVALRAIYWTRDRLDAGSASVVNRRWDFLSELPKMHTHDKVMFVHGSPRDPTNEYVFPEFIYDKSKMDNIFSRVTQYCFQGHTHMPGVFTPDLEFIKPSQCDNVFPLGKEKLMVSVGSVGQPRDEDNRACYVILDHDAKKIFFRRVEYDFEATIKKIYSFSELDRMLGDRLRTGR